jgi:4-amino-4-deoxy-L-arabinose transferase-like glycosyltransferase
VTTTPVPARPAELEFLDEPVAAGRLRRLVRGRAEDPRWVRPAVAALLAGTAVLYLVDLGASGWANSFYSAAVQAGTRSWKAFFFGSFDAANLITVDKPPGSLWVMELAARAFGVNPWAILVPQALEGVASVGLLYLAVRRTFSAGAGLLAGAILALTPVAALMFRFDNPDALLTLVLIGATYATIRAVQSGRTGWLLLAAALVGFGFTTKMLQALIVVPALAGAYLLAGPRAALRRVGQLLGAGAVLVVSAGWWVVAVMAVPASARPYIGGSQDNSLWNLIFGYNGFGRLTGNETGSVGGAGRGGTGQWGPTGLGRMFNTDFGGQISWLLPAALLGLAAGLWLTRRARRTDPARAAFVAWGGTLVVTGLVFSLSQGIIHPYYTVALAPPIGALVGAAAVLLWARRSHLAARATLAVGLAGTAVWADVLLRRTPGWHPWLQPAVLAAGLAGAVALVAAAGGAGAARRRLAAAAGGVAVVTALGVPGAASIATAATPHSGAIPTAGPGSSFGPPGGGPAGRPRGGRRFPGSRAAGGFAGRLPGGFGGPGTGGFPGAGRPGVGGFGGAGGARGAGGGAAGAGGPAGAAGGPGTGPALFPGGLGAFAGTGTAGPGGPLRGLFGRGGGLLDASRPSAALVRALEANASRYTWVAAAVGAESASGYQLATGDPVMALGGFNGTDPYPTLAGFEQLVVARKVHWFIAGGGVGGPGAGGAGSDATAITRWVEQHYAARSIGGTSVYDLTAPAGGATGSPGAAAGA